MGEELQKNQGGSSRLLSTDPNAADLFVDYPQVGCSHLGGQLTTVSRCVGTLGQGSRFGLLLDKDANVRVGSSQLGYIAVVALTQN